VWKRLPEDECRGIHEGKLKGALKTKTAPLWSRIWRAAYGEDDPNSSKAIRRRIRDIKEKEAQVAWDEDE